MLANAIVFIVKSGRKESTETANERPSECEREGKNGKIFINFSINLNIVIVIFALSEHKVCTLHTHTHTLLVNVCL